MISALPHDVLCLRPFAPLRRFDVVMGTEEGMGLCNAVILARPAAPFVTKAVWSSADTATPLGPKPNPEAMTVAAPLRRFIRQRSSCGLNPSHPSVTKALSPDGSMASPPGTNGKKP